MSVISAIATAQPEHVYHQAELVDAVLDVWAQRGELSTRDAERFRRFNQSAGVSKRHLAYPLERYRGIRDFGDSNDLWIAAAKPLAADVLRVALKRACVAPRDVDVIFFASITGIATPSIDAHLINALGLNPEIKRVPIFGLGCAAGAAMLSRAHDYLLAYPRAHVAVVSVELCSLTLQSGDLSIENLIATSLFGDGAAAAILSGSETATVGPRIMHTLARFCPDSEHLMGWAISASGFKVKLSRDIPSRVAALLPGAIDRLLRAEGLTRTDVGYWLPHPGGPKVLDHLAQTLALPAEAFALSRAQLSAFGNLSSATIMWILAAQMEALERPVTKSPKHRRYAVAFAMGPGFSMELLLLSM